jgi:polysaccharide export outer membrane protein
MMFRSVLALCIWTGVVAGAGAAVAEGKPAAAGVKEAAAPQQTVGSPKMDEYQIGVHDLIEISVFQVPELSRTVRVNARGQISLPMIGAVDAGGLTAHELETVIAKKLSENLLQDPQVSIFIKEFVSQRVVIEGKVKKTGVYPISGRTTLLQALALAEGLDPLANENAVKIFRQHTDGRKEVMVFNLEEIRAGRVEDPAVKGNDVVVVEEAAGRAAIKTITDTIRGIFSFGRF